MNLAFKKKKMHFKTSSVNWLKGGGGWWKERNRWYHRLFQAALRSDQIAHIFWNFLILRFLLPLNRFSCVLVCLKMVLMRTVQFCSFLGSSGSYFTPPRIYNPSTGRPRAGLHQERVFWTIRWDAGLFLVTAVRVRAPHWCNYYLHNDPYPRTHLSDPLGFRLLWTLL